MSADFNVLLKPVPGDKPGGSDGRDAASYEQMSLEMDKLTSLTSDSIPNWIRIEQLATEFLQSQGKDYLVAAWLAEAWVERYALAGLASGLSLFAGLVDQFWETGFPTLARLRGRRNAIVWWTERAIKWLESQGDITIATELSEQLLSAAKALDSGLSEKDPDAPSLSTLIGHLHRIPIDEPPPVKEVQQPTPVEAPSTGNQPAKVVDDSAQAPNAGASEVVNAPDASKVSDLGKVNAINNLEDLAAVLKPAQDYVAQLGPALYAFNNSHPLVIHFSRFAARSNIFKLPNAKDGKTLIGSPPVAIRDAFEKIISSKNAQGMVDFCESRIRTFPFWFDLDFHSYKGFSTMGDAGGVMAHTIVETLLNFLNRLPTIEQLSFSDGMPFASLDTLAWIKQCRAERSGAGPQDAFGEVQGAANAALTEGQLDKALETLQRFIDGTASRRDQFRARIALVEISLSEHPNADLRPLVQPLIDDCDRLQLDEWEPALAAQAWALKVRAAKQVLSNKSADVTESQRAAARAELDSGLKHLSIVDFAQAAALVDKSKS